MQVNRAERKEQSIISEVHRGDPCFPCRPVFSPLKSQTGKSARKIESEFSSALYYLSISRGHPQSIPFVFPNPLLNLVKWNLSRLAALCVPLGCLFDYIPAKNSVKDL